MKKMMVVILAAMVLAMALFPGTASAIETREGFFKYFSPEEEKESVKKAIDYFLEIVLPGFSRPHQIEKECGECCVAATSNEARIIFYPRLPGSRELTGFQRIRAWNADRNSVEFEAVFFDLDENGQVDRVEIQVDDYYDWLVVYNDMPGPNFAIEVFEVNPMARSEHIIPGCLWGLVPDEKILPHIQGLIDKIKPLEMKDAAKK